MANTRTQADRELDWSTGRELERKDAEIERLRAALEKIAGKNDLSGIPESDCPSAAYAALHECECIARVALDGSGTNEQKVREDV